MTIFVALVHGREGAYGISYPDVPGATSLGETIEETMLRARDGLAGHIEAMTDAGFPLPSPSTVERLKADPDHREAFDDAVAVALVDVDVPARSVRLDVSMEEHLVRRIDRRAKALGESRSSFLAKAAQRLLAEADTI